MSVFSDFHNNGMDYLLEAAGESITYVDGDGEETEITGALIGNERVVQTAPERGEGKKRVREFSFQKRFVSSPKTNAKIVYADEDWPIVGIKNDSKKITRVVCEIEGLTLNTHRGYRPGR